jgi:hypothetical protein
MNKDKFKITRCKFKKKRDNLVNVINKSGIPVTYPQVIELAQAQLDRLKNKDAIIAQIKLLIDSE